MPLGREKAVGLAALTAFSLLPHRRLCQIAEASRKIAMKKLNPP
jgi:hypothetical protein